MSDERAIATRGLLSSLRTRLLDLSTRNPLILLNHARNTGSRTHLRAVDIDINTLVKNLMEGDEIVVHALPDRDVDEPVGIEDECVEKLDNVDVSQESIAFVLDKDDKEIVGDNGITEVLQPDGSLDYGVMEIDGSKERESDKNLVLSEADVGVNGHDMETKKDEIFDGMVADDIYVAMGWSSSLPDNLMNTVPMEDVEKSDSMETFLPSVDSSLPSKIESGRLAGQVKSRSVESVVDHRGVEEEETLTVETVLSEDMGDIQRQLRVNARIKAEQKAMMEAHATSLGIDVSYEMANSSKDGALVGNVSGSDFQTLLYSDDFQKLIGRMYNFVKSHERETGINTLHLALGSLEWYEADYSDKAIISPLVMVQVVLNRHLVDGDYEYTLSLANDGPSINNTLSEKLWCEFGIRLPELVNSDDIWGYFNEVTYSICRTRRRWCVRSHVTLAQFPFARLVMFNDITPDLAEKPLVRALLVGSGASGGMRQRFAVEQDVDSPEVKEVVPFIALEADASQHSAIYDAMSGRNLVIQGPPGTGKSQTIANIIAAGMAAGKRILFMAEKQTAIQVVKARLDEIGLGEFCLNLHSSRSSRSDFMAEMIRRMDLRSEWRSEDELVAANAELVRRRDWLNTYDHIMNSSFGRTGMSVNDIIWADRMRRSRMGDLAYGLEDVVIDKAVLMTSVDVENIRERLKRFDERVRFMYDHWIDITSHPWYGVMHKDGIVVDFSAVNRVISLSVQNAKIMYEALTELCVIGFDKNAGIDSLINGAKSLILLDIATNVDFPYQVFASNKLRENTVLWLVKSREAIRAVEQLEVWGIHVPAGTYEVMCTVFDDVNNSVSVAVADVGDDFHREMTVGGMKSWSNSIHEMAEQLKKFILLAEEVAGSVGLLKPKTQGEMMALFTFVDCVQALELSWMDKISPCMMGRNAKNDFDVVRRDCEEVYANGKSLDVFYTMSSLPDVRVLKEAANALRSAGFMAFMNTDVRQATKVYQGLRKTVGNVSRSDMVGELDVLIEYCDKVAGLAANQTYKDLIGGEYRGVDTDFKGLEPIFHWVATVRRRLLPFGEMGNRLFNILLTSNPDNLERFYVSLRNINPTSCLMKLADFSGGVCSLDDVVDMHERADRIYEAADIFRKIGLDDDVLLFRIKKLVLDLQGVVQKLKDAAPSKDLLDGVVGRHINPLCDVVRIQQAVDIAGKISDLDVSQAVKDHVFRSSSELLSGHIKLLAERFLHASIQLSEDVESLRKFFHINDVDFFGDVIGNIAPGQIFDRLKRVGDARDLMADWVSFNREKLKILDDNLGSLLDFQQKNPSTFSLVDIFDVAFYHTLVKDVYATHPVLDEFSGISQEEARARFADLDRQATLLGRAKVVYDLTQRIPPAGDDSGRRSEWTDYALLQHETSKQRGHLPLRKLLDQGGKAIQVLKPCFMMSPISVAQYLKSDGLEFDILVIDEASQMLPEYAMGAIARSAQIIVVGDHMQLPPTNFFGAAREDIDEDDDEDTIDAESILDLARSHYQPIRRLRMHYRSRHESLIAFSNRRFYDDALIVFPSPDDGGGKTGVSLVKVDGFYVGNVNHVEADAVCQAAVRHIYENPMRSLGIGTINSKQRDLIMEKMDLLAAKDPIVAEFCARESWGSRIEPFFVKNLETIQGDERDTILISTLFGPPGPGRKPFQRFGAINRVSGHRRLNVLFTRARHQLVVYSSLEPSDISTDPNPLKGAQVLRDYLIFAAAGRLDTGRETGQGPDSDFEVFVSERLRQAGYDVVPQVGAAGFFIDLAVRHPNIDGTYLLGIECDGATYHSSKSARDRDILRQQILEGLGWKIYRIWSTDWFRDPEGQTRKLLNTIKNMETGLKT